MKPGNYEKSINKAISMLKCFNPQEPELSGTEISKKLGIHRATAYRILATLSEGKLLEKNEKSGKYRIGPAQYVLGSLYLKTTDVLKAAEPITKVLNDLTSEVVNVAIFDKGYSVLILREESKHAIRIMAHIGSIYPAYANATGKALLSELTEAQIDSLYPKERLRSLTPKTIATKTELKQDLEQIRKTGVAFSREEVHEGVETIASLIRDASGRAVAAICTAIPVVRMTEAKRLYLVSLIRMGASLVSYRLGYQDMVDPVRDIEEIRLWWKQNQLDSVFRVNSFI